MENTNDTTTSTTTPAAPAPVVDAGEVRRQAIMKESDYWSDGPKTRALRDEMKQLTLGPAPQQQPKVDAAPEPANEARRRELTKLLADPKLDAGKRAELQRELTAVLAGQATPDEVAALQDATVGELRERVGLKIGDVAPPALHGSWNEEGEATVLRSAIYHGMTAEDTRGLLGWYVKNVFTPAVGDPANVDWNQIHDDFVDAVVEKYHVPKKLAEALVTWQKKRLGFEDES